MFSTRSGNDPPRGRARAHEDDPTSRIARDATAEGRTCARARATTEFGVCPAVVRRGTAVRPPRARPRSRYCAKRRCLGAEPRAVSADAQRRPRVRPRRSAIGSHADGHRRCCRRARVDTAAAQARRAHADGGRGRVTVSAEGPGIELGQETVWRGQRFRRGGGWGGGVGRERRRGAGRDTVVRRDDLTSPPRGRNMGESGDRRAHQCVGCLVWSPETDTNYTLISSRHGWRLTRGINAAGRSVMEWRCPTCWTHRQRNSIPATSAGGKK
jgi:hypothetical protein